MSDTHAHALRRMVDAWAQTAAHVERGYTLTFDDYLNDIDLRRLIDERLREMRDDGDDGDDAIPRAIRVALADADEHFRRATVGAAENIWGDDNAREEGWSADREWYYYRTPQRLPPSW